MLPSILASWVKVSFVSALLWVTLVVHSFAQDSGTIAGQVLDALGYGVSGASIQVRNTATGTLYRTASTATGEYPLVDLPIGSYELFTTMANMKDYARPDVAVRAGHRVRVNVTPPAFTSTTIARV